MERTRNYPGRGTNSDSSDDSFLPGGETPFRRQPSLVQAKVWTQRRKASSDLSVVSSGMTDNERRGSRAAQAAAHLKDLFKARDAARTLRDGQNFSIRNSSTTPGAWLSDIDCNASSGTGSGKFWRNPDLEWDKVIQNVKYGHTGQFSAPTKALPRSEQFTVRQGRRQGQHRVFRGR